MNQAIKILMDSDNIKDKPPHHGFSVTFGHLVDPSNNEIKGSL